MQTGRSGSRRSFGFGLIPGEAAFIIDKRSARLHSEFPESDCRLAEDLGHMIHHVVREQAMDAIDAATLAAMPCSHDRLGCLATGYAMVFPAIKAMPSPKALIAVKHNRYLSEQATATAPHMGSAKRFGFRIHDACSLHLCRQVLHAYQYSVVPDPARSRCGFGIREPHPENFATREVIGIAVDAASSACINRNQEMVMEGIKAVIEGEGVESSVEFSVEEVIGRNSGKAWKDMSDADRDAALKDYALALFTRDTGRAGDLRVRLEGGTFSTVRNGDV